ncbi:MAG: deacylase [Saprospiraceae bacterium]|nr:MAG: deacylase [Saprospiraceae bacterium]
MEPQSLLIKEPIPSINELDIEAVPRGKISHFWLNLVTDGMGIPIKLPVIVARGRQDGKVVGLTAVVHGNELNGIPVIQRLFKELDPENMVGTVVGIPVVNVPSLLRKKRRFPDGSDLNHLMPGKPTGSVSEVYAYRVVQRIVRHFNYLVDLHTASFGRINSYYIRADLSNPVTREMAMLQNAQIIVNNPPSDGTLRGAADELKIPAITLEVGDPNKFQKGMIRSSLTGIHNLLIYLGITEGIIDKPVNPTVICDASHWIYTDTGGILNVHPGVTDLVKKGDPIASLYDIFGDLKMTYMAQEDGIIIGRSVNPVNQTGGRILHLGTKIW